MNQDESPRQRAQSVVLGRFKVLYRPGEPFEQTRVRLDQQGYHIEETPHFLLARRPDSPLVLVVHRWSLETIDNTLSYYLVQELTLAGVVTSDQDFRALFLGVVTSLSPHAPVEAWNCFSLNTLGRLRAALKKPSSSVDGADPITAFAQIYSRLFSLRVGESLLDVGCACAFWPVMVAEQHRENPGNIVGVDKRQEAITLSRNLAACAGVNHITFLQGDVTDPAFPAIGTFDTVTAIHLLEHLPEAQSSRVLEHLLDVTVHRLIFAVPFEEQATMAYGHEVVCTPETLERWGTWCLDYLHGKGRYWQEEVRGGMLIVDKGCP